MWDHKLLSQINLAVVCSSAGHAQALRYAFCSHTTWDAAAQRARMRSARSQVTIHSRKQRTPDTADFLLRPPVLGEAGRIG